MSKKFAVIYRQGGRDRFRWLKVSKTFSSREEAMVDASEISRQGYFCEVVSEDSARHGLPETYEIGENPADFELRDGWLVRRFFPLTEDLEVA